MIRASLSVDQGPENLLSFRILRRLRKLSGYCGTLEAMRATALIFALFALRVAAGDIVRFDHCGSGGLPPKWTVSMTHTGGVPRWELVADASAPSPPCVLAQLSADPTAGRFPLAIWEGALFRDGEVSVAFKPVSGSVDQAAGVIWRYRDPNNYYIVRANALENNVVLYKVVDGTRVSIAPKGLPSRAYGVKHPVTAGKWAILRATFDGNLFTVFLDGKQLFQAEDRSLGLPGRTGLWTKADSVTYFDDFEAKQK